MTTVILQFFTARREPGIGLLLAAGVAPHGLAVWPGGGRGPSVPRLSPAPRVGAWGVRCAVTGSHGGAGVSMPRPACGGWNLRSKSETGTRQARGVAARATVSSLWPGKADGPEQPLLLPYSHDITERPEDMRLFPAGLRRYLSVCSLLQ
jgi:hypothetical protein